MAKAVSLHIGLNEFDPAHYGEPGTLAGCENDARDMAALAKRERFKPVVPPLLTAKATASNVVGAIKKAAASLREGDTLFVTYAGHGAQVPDTNGDERDRMDETWCLYGRMLIDDELAALWSSFRAGVRIVMLSDSCHSGSVSRAARRGAVEPRRAGVRYRLLPVSRALSVYRNNKGIYDAIQVGTRTSSQAPIDASVLLISGCQDSQLSSDGDVNGLFTETLKAVWRDGAFEGTYRSLRDAIAALMPKYQQPRYSLEGAANPSLEKERPFSAVPHAPPKVIRGGARVAEEKATPLATILALLKYFGLNNPTADSDLRAWAKEVEKQDAKLGLPASRADAFVAECFGTFANLPLEKRDLLEGNVRTPRDLVSRLPNSKRRSRGSNENLGSFSGATLVTDGVTKEQFLLQNKAALDKILAAVNDKLRTKYGADASLVSREDLCVLFYCESGLKAGKVDANYQHSEGERGVLPLPSNIQTWNGANAPAWDQPMSAVLNVEHFFLYIGHLKNKDLTGAPRHIYDGLFDVSGIRGNPAVGAKVLAGVVHGYFDSGNYQDRSIPYDHLIASYRADERLAEFMKNTTYRHAGTAVLTGRERNIETALGLV
jgi:metacaspase-1